MMYWSVCKQIWSKIKYENYQKIKRIFHRTTHFLQDYKMNWGMQEYKKLVLVHIIEDNKIVFSRNESCFDAEAGCFSIYNRDVTLHNMSMIHE